MLNKVSDLKDMSDSCPATMVSVGAPSTISEFSARCIGLKDLSRILWIVVLVK